MTQTKLRKRDEIQDQFKWNQPSIFPDTQSWEEAAARLPESD